MKRYQKGISFVCAVLFFLQLLPLGASASQELPAAFALTAAPRKEAYEKGEEIFVDVALKNTGYADLRHCTLTMQYSAPDTYLAAGTVEQTVEEVEYGGVWNDHFTLCENEAVMTLGEKLPAALRLLTALLKKAVRLVSQLTPLIEYTKARLETVTEDFPHRLPLLFTPRVTVPAGRCTVLYDGKEVECRFFVRFDLPAAAAPQPTERKGETQRDFCLTAVVTPSPRKIEALTFGGVYDEGGYTGGLVCFDGSTGRVGVSFTTAAGPEQLAFRLTDLAAGKDCPVKLNYEGRRLKLWVYTNPLDEDPYPLFDIEFDFPGRAYGGSAGVSALSAVPAEPMTYDGETYTNPVCDNAADPQILFDGGVYYLYATNSFDGYAVSTSTDLVHWTDRGKVAEAKDLVGDHWFWAPEVYRYRGRYYLLYTSHLGDEIGLGVAAADSPMGPFVKTGESWIVDLPALDGTFFFDDDGRIYLYFSVVDGGQSLWGCEMNEDLCSVKPETLTRLSAPEGWEKRINEGPAMLKHNGVYYLTYSGDGYDSVNYGVGYMTSTRPLGTFTKSPLNPVLKYTAFLHGPGHHCFVPSPDGSELFICYHSHYSTSQVHVRRMNIDRVKFVPTESGTDALAIYGPTVTPQPTPK